MLKKEQLLNHRLLEGLSEDHAKVIAELSKNDERLNIDSAVDDAVGRLHGMYDEDFKELFPDAERGSEKSYKFWKAQVADLKSNYESLKNSKPEVNENELQERFEAEKQGIIDSYEKKLDEARQEYEQKIESDLRNSLLREYDLALNERKSKFKPDIPEEVLEGFLENKKNDFLNNHEYDFDQELGRFVFKDADGKILRDDKMSPMTIGQIIDNSHKTIYDEGREKTGTGSGKPKPKKSGFVVDEFDSKADATRGLNKYLTETLGLSPNSDDYISKRDEIYQSEIAPSNLPVTA